MREYLEKKHQTAKGWLITLIVSVAVFIASIFVAVSDKSGATETAFLPLITGAVMYTVFCIFLICHLPVLMNYAYLEKKELLDIANDISLDAPPSIAKAKIYCGRKALYSKKARTVVPYSQIVWAHRYERSVNGITVERALILYTAEGKKFSVPCTEDEAKWLLGTHLLPACPNMILGFGAEQKKRYKNEYPLSQKPKKLAQRVWGIILIVLGVAYLTMLIINIKEAKIVDASLVAAGHLIGGAVLFTLGSRK